MIWGICKPNVWRPVLGYIEAEFSTEQSLENSWRDLADIPPQKYIASANAFIKKWIPGFAGVGSPVGSPVGFGVGTGVEQWSCRRSHSSRSANRLVMSRYIIRRKRKIEVNMLWQWQRQYRIKCRKFAGRKCQNFNRLLDAVASMCACGRENVKTRTNSPSELCRTKLIVRWATKKESGQNQNIF